MIMISSTCRVATCRDCRRDVANECLMLKYVPQGCSRDRSRPYKWMEATSVYENQMHRTFGLNQKKQPAGAAFLRKDRESLLRRALRDNEPFQGSHPVFPDAKKAACRGCFFAERQGFEPWVPVRVQRFSRPSRSTTPASFLGFCTAKVQKFFVMAKFFQQFR